MKRLSLISIALVVASMVVSCTPPAGSENKLVQAVRDFPAGNYIFYLAAAPADIFESPLFQRMKEEAFAEEWQSFSQELKDSSGMAPEEMGVAVAAVAMPQLFAAEPPEMIMQLGGEFTLDGIKSMLLTAEARAKEENPDLENTITYEEGEYEGVAFMSQKTTDMMSETEFHFLAAESGMVMATPESLKAYIDLGNGSGERLLNDADVKQALALVEPDAQATLMFWKIRSTLGPLMHMAAAATENEQEAEMIRKFANIEVLVISVTMTEDLKVAAKVDFGEAETAEEFVALYNLFIADAPAEYFEEEGEGEQDPSMPQVNAEQVKMFFDATSVSSAGSVVTLTTNITGDSELMQQIIENMKKEVSLPSDEVPAIEGDSSEDEGEEMETATS